VPATLAARDYERLVPQLIERVRAREAGGTRRSDVALERAATRLATQLAGELDLLTRLHSVSWSTRQNHRWGSCTVSTGDIRLSSRLQPMPNWVIDYVLFHELLHLEETNHSRRFHELMRRYPEHDRAKGFLQGVAHALATGAEPWPSDVDDDQDQLPTDVGN